LARTWLIVPPTGIPVPLVPDVPDGPTGPRV